MLQQCAKNAQICAQACSNSKYFNFWECMHPEDVNCLVSTHAISTTASSTTTLLTHTHTHTTTTTQAASVLYLLYYHLSSCRRWPMIFPCQCCRTTEPHFPAPFADLYINVPGTSTLNNISPHIIVNSPERRTRSVPTLTAHARKHAPRFYIGETHARIHTLTHHITCARLAGSTTTATTFATPEAASCPTGQLITKSPDCEIACATLKYQTILSDKDEVSLSS